MIARPGSASTRQILLKLFCRAAKAAVAPITKAMIPMILPNSPLFCSPALLTIPSRSLVVSGPTKEPACVYKASRTSPGS